MPERGKEIKDTITTKKILKFTDLLSSSGSRTLRETFHFSLRWKATLSFSLLLIPVVGTLFLAFIRYEWIFLSREAGKRAYSLARNMAINARDPLLALDSGRWAQERLSSNPERELRQLVGGKYNGKREVRSHWKSRSSVVKYGYFYTGGICRCVIFRQN